MYYIYLIIVIIICYVL